MGIEGNKRDNRDTDKLRCFSPTVSPFFGIARLLGCRSREADPRVG